MFKKYVGVFVVVFLGHFIVSLILTTLLGDPVLGPFIYRVGDSVWNLFRLLHVILPPVLLTLLIRFVREGLGTKGKKLMAAVAVLLFWILWMFGVIIFVDNEFIHRMLKTFGSMSLDSISGLLVPIALLIIFTGAFVQWVVSDGSRAGGSG